ncbi:MAG: hypothetical protein ALECFALPRED_003452 [Alectoria fallacina]|uniref:Uncharacterized protein n=1 Tax=Alectoria fallacina TaxID=1903189 RepID=A0A8H3FJX6_9LECA|nr:MAG: hypothetical protein ALECFALPRED_003452 [Alectoria fallacina]
MLHPNTKVSRASSSLSDYAFSTAIFSVPGLNPVFTAVSPTASTTTGVVTTSNSGLSGSSSGGSFIGSETPTTPSVINSGAMMPMSANTPVTIAPSSAPVMAGPSSSPALSSETTGGIVTPSKVGTMGASEATSGTAASSTVNAPAINTSSASASSNNSKKSVAGQFHSFAGTAGILVLIGILVWM